MKEKIFRYENRFSVFFYRLAETIVFAYRNNDNVCHYAVASCIKNLLVLISEYGETSEHIVDFFNGLRLRSKIYSQLPLLDSAKLTIIVVFSRNMASLTKF